ncbi:MAG: hypothetical protein ACRYFS_08460 [Janthinobacterium lividum]
MKPASANSNRVLILRRQYRFYQVHHCLPGMEMRAAAYYNQCVDDSDPSVLRGTNLPHHLP